jgi:Dolichyl-phosphate-mannose-protein mannosyltransferase
MDNGLTPSQSAEPFTLTSTRSAEASVSRLSKWAGRLPISPAWELLAILVVQAVLSVRLVHADTAYQGEAMQLWAGHLEWAHWLHGTPIPAFATYFSGAPVVYAPLGALADGLGGLAAARILSLVFMLGATLLLWNVTNRLFGRQAGFFAAALFAVLGPTLHLGAFASYDAMSVFLIALATWLVVRVAGRPNATGWMIAAGAVLALANVTAYSSVLFDVVVILVALLTALPEAGGRQATTRCLTVLVVVIVLLLAGLLIGGGSYAQGFQAAMFGGVQGRASAFTVMSDAWLWAGVVMVAAIGGVVISWMRREGGPLTALLAILTAGAFVGPFEQAQLHTAATLNKHVGLGSWFAAIAAGYAIDKLIVSVPDGRTRLITCGACVVALALPVSVGVSQSQAFSTDWPNSSDFLAIFGPIAAHGNGRLLVEDPAIAEYYLPSGRQWDRWSSTRNIVLASGASTGGPSKSAGLAGSGNAGTFGEKIAAHYFAIVALNFTDTTSLDKQITADLKHNHHYCVLQVVPYGIEIPPVGIGNYVVWRYNPNIWFPRAKPRLWNCG